MQRVCSGCGVITDKRRCPDCTRKHEATRARRSKGNYDSGWRTLTARAKKEHPWCANCLTGGTPDNPLTGDHITPRRHGGRNVRGNVQVLCLRCNSRKGARPQLGGASK